VTLAVRRYLACDGPQSRRGSTYPAAKNCLLAAITAVLASVFTCAKVDV
jgi:hypothetical protein